MHGLAWFIVWNKKKHGTSHTNGGHARFRAWIYMNNYTHRHLHNDNSRMHCIFHMCVSSWWNYRALDGTVFRIWQTDSDWLQTKIRKWKMMRAAAIALDHSLRPFVRNSGCWGKCSGPLLYTGRRSKTSAIGGKCGDINLSNWTHIWTYGSHSLRWKMSDWDDRDD